jgi:hypothetical protein
MFYCRSDEAELQVCEVDFRGCASCTCRTAAAHGRSLENEGGSQHLILQYQKAKKKGEAYATTRKLSNLRYSKGYRIGVRRISA